MPLLRYADSDVCSRDFWTKIRSTSTPPSTQSPEQRGPLKGTRLASRDSLPCIESLAALGLKGEIISWKSHFLELKDSDIHGPGQEEDEPSEGRIITSWIWLVGNSSEPPDSSHCDDDADSDDDDSLSQHAASSNEVAISIHFHWARCQAQVEQHEEEVKLTLKEM